MRSTFLSFARAAAVVLAATVAGGLAPGTINTGHAQVLENALFTAGTVTKNAQNQHWAYVALQIDDPVKLRQRKLAVYSKAGLPASPNAFARKGVITVQTDPLILQTLIARAVNLGESGTTLEFALNEIFGTMIPDPSLSLAKKLSAVIQGAMNDPQQYGSLVLLSRTHPAVAMALGMAHAEPIAAGDSTFELREFDLVKGTDIGVVGRVTVTAGSPVVLPAPSRPVEIPDLSAKGHLNARMRWGTPVPLRRLSLLHFGYNLYRIPRAFAEANNLHNVPPDAAVLAGMAEQGLNGIKRINQAPALAARAMSETEAADTVMDPKTAFINDDNGLAQDNAVPFKDGDQFYYFVTARDLLGRDGLASFGTLVTMTDRVPPSAPRGVVVENDYRTVNGLPVQRLRVTWKQRPVENGNVVIGYYVHRWESPGESAEKGGNPAFNRISPLIPHAPGQATQTFLDETDGAPAAPGSYDRTVYYTVRAVEQVSAGQNVSGNSAPAAGVLRDRIAPAGPGGGVYIECCDPVTLVNGMEDARHATPDAAEVVFDLICTRETSAIRFADFFLYSTAAANHHVRLHFPPGTDKVRKRLVLRRTAVTPPFTVFCRTGSTPDRLSPFAQQSITTLPGNGERRLVKFRGVARCTEILWNEAAEASGCEGHDPNPGLQGGEGAAGNAVHGLKIKVDLTDTTKEWRLYRRIDDGVMTLLRQGLADFQNVQQIEVVDKDLPASAAIISYYGQLLDQNGNASQLALLSKAVPVQAAPAAPMLAPLKIAGTPGNPSVLVKWFCPPQGVERFEVLVHVAPGTTPNLLSPLLGENHYLPLEQFADGPVDADTTETLPHGAYFTPQVGGAFGSGPDFSFTFPMAKDKTYLIHIASISRNGSKRSIGNVQRLKWQGAKGLASEPVPGTPNVPWPEILPPEPTDAWSPAMVPVQLNESTFRGVGVRIGELKPAEFTIVNSVVHPLGRGSLKSAFYPPATTSSTGDQLFPLVLYRYQVANGLFPQVSGDLIQVTPLMETVALAEKSGPGGDYMAVKDPFIRIYNQTIPETRTWIYLLDTQPVVRRARYAYVAVRFGKNGEIASVHPLPEITIN